VMSFGAAYGIAAYELFGKLYSKPGGMGGNSSGLMLVSFLAGIPLAMGVLVALLSRRRKLGGLAGAGALGMLSIFLFVFAAGALLREGMICIVMALPFFLAMVVIGVVAGWIVSLATKGKSPGAFGIVLLPFAFGAVEQRIAPPDSRQHIVRSVVIQASPETVWEHINFPTGIRPTELETGIAYRIGVPYPVEARTLEPRMGGKRQLTWQRGVSFEEEITAWEPNRHIAWRYRFQPNSFPEGSLDDHIVIGGRYFDLEDTSYTLTPEAAGPDANPGTGTRLEIRVNTRVTTHFNWYAAWWAEFLVADTAEAILGFYKQRSERPAARS